MPKKNLRFHKKIASAFRKKRLDSKDKKKSGWLKKILISCGVLFVAGVIGITGVLLYFLADLPPIDSKQFYQVAESTIIYDREGNVLYTIHGEENRKEVNFDDIPKHIIDATIAIEDDQFFNHYGFDIPCLFKAIPAQFFGIGQKRGCSTITQQLVKNRLLSPETTISRKIRELLLSIKVEQKFSKNEILAMYLNTIPYGSNSYGIEMASRTYFGKSAKDLTLLESAVLAGLPNKPSRYNPYGNGRDLLMGYFNEDGKYAKGRKDLVLDRMLKLEMITREEWDQAIEEGIDVEFKRARENIKHPHFVLYVKELLENKFGKEAVETGGLHVYTTLDPKIQATAEEVIAEKFETYPEKYGANNAALLTVDTEKGHILAMVGSSDYFNEEIDGNVNVVFRKRLPGSSFKPLVYAAAFAKGFAPATVLYDLETDFGNDYIPQNYDGEFLGPVSARKALATSRNVPAVKMAFLAGVDNVVRLAKMMGLSDLIDADQYGTSIGLGTGEATLYQMVTAYTTFARGGKKIAFTPFLRIETSSGKEIESNEEREPKELEVLDPRIAYSITHMLSDKSARPADWTALQIPDQINAAKTGTSNKRVEEVGKPEGVIKPLDNWTMGYTTKIVTGVWVGNNDASPLKFEAAGLTTAGKIWNAIMTTATEDLDLEPFPKPAGMEWIGVSKWSGLLPSEHTAKEDIIPELFNDLNTPEEVDQTFLTVEIDRVSKKLPTELTPPEAITNALLANFRSQNPTDSNWEEPVQEWAREFIQEKGEETLILTEIPTEYDDKHTSTSAENKPSITIISPSDKTDVPRGWIEVQVDIEALYGVKKVEYFLNKRLIDTATEYPYTGKFRIRSKQPGHTQRIGATVTDQLFYKASDVINIGTTEEDDEERPITRISYPEEGAIFPPDTRLTIQTKSTDNVGVSEVVFFFNDQEVGRTKEPPYNHTITLPNQIAPHAIRVFTKDLSGNTASDEVLITIEEAAKESRKRTRFIFPKSESTFSQSQQLIDFFFQISILEQKNTIAVRVLSEFEESGEEIPIYEYESKSMPQNYSFSWHPKQKGAYKFTIETTIKNGKKKRSTPLELTIE